MRFTAFGWGGAIKIYHLGNIFTVIMKHLSDHFAPVRDYFKDPLLLPMVFMLVGLLMVCLMKSH